MNQLTLFAADAAPAAPRRVAKPSTPMLLAMESDWQIGGVFEVQRKSQMEHNFIVVENSGMVGERDIANFSTLAAAWAYIERVYTDAERDQFSPKCLFPDVCFEQDGERTYVI